MKLTPDSKKMVSAVCVFYLLWRDVDAEGDSVDSYHAWAAATSYSFTLQAFPVSQHPN